MKIIFLDFDGVMDTARYDEGNFNVHQQKRLVVNPVMGLDEVAAEKAIRLMLPEKMRKNMEKWQMN